MNAFRGLVAAALAVNVRQPATLLFGFVMPLVIIFVLDLVAGGVLGDAGAASHVVPGILAYSVANAALSAAAMTFTAWRVSGLFPRLRLEPVSPVPLVASRFVVAVVVMILQAAVFVAVGVAFLGLTVDVQLLMAAVPLVAIAGLGFFLIGGIVGLYASSEQAVASGLNLLLLPLAFLSGCFLPLERLPSGVQSVMQYTPLSALVTGLADATNGMLGWAGFMQVAGVLLFTVVAAGLLFVRLYGRKTLA